jgi:hypothetical protein
MTKSHTPSSIHGWLKFVNIDDLKDADVEKLAHVDIEDDAQLAWLMSNWVKPEYLRWNEAEQRRLLEILIESKNWSEKQMKHVFEGCTVPSGQDINDIDRFMSALRAEILGTDN